ncbi:hypothetical protein HOLleu_43644 [Holothuria leucospilota]|uniref:Uncharacterized protein n=1 Tax=Holothuria leucospilota TaxID=206669 RepID=A0A9Q0YDJ6_HOLLE|nr:hypothetical protein HOLleu_43644 [Holothuria leucospilota]
MSGETTCSNEEVTLKKIQNLFNSKFAEASGIVGGRMPYSANNVQMIGLLDDIPFKRPSHYGKNQRSRIWNARASLRCHINDAECST